MTTTNREIRVSGKTLELALEDAAKQLNAPLDQVRHRVISQTKGGILSFFGKKIEIAAYVETTHKQKAGTDKAAAQRPPKTTQHAATRPNVRTPVSESPRSYDEDTSERRELDQETIDNLCEDLREFCQGICTRMFQAEAEVTSTLDGDRLVLDVASEELANHMAKNSKISEALEHILRKKPRHLKRELPFRIFVDVNGLRRKREEELVEMAKDLSAKVDENQRPIVLNYKSSYDRKIIHMALDKDERVYTKSIGSGSNRKLMILPYKKADGDDGSLNQ